jgi:protein tyrosine phosphatase (PTP) superfamily phosphohydrolase (DUF442 family)
MALRFLRAIALTAAAPLLGVPTGCSATPGLTEMLRLDDVTPKNYARSEDGSLQTFGQPTAGELLSFADSDVGTVICLRAAGEDGTGWEEEFARRNDIHFVRLPIEGPQDLNRNNAEALAKAMASAPGGAAVYCGSSNRVGALIALKAFYVDGVPADEALELGKQHGLTRMEAATRRVLEQGR